MDNSKKSGAGRIVRFMIGLMAALVVTFFVSYFSVSRLYSSYLDKKDAEEESAEQATALVEAEENVKNCGFTMVYLDNPDTAEVDYSLLRIFNERTSEMSIFQIPTDSQVTLSDEVYEEISSKTDATVNKTLYFSELGTYFEDQETKYEMINLVVQDLIGGVEVRSYEAMDYETFVEMINWAEPVILKMTQIVSYTNEEGDTVRLAPNTEYEVDGRMALGILTYDDGFGSGDSGRIDRTATYLKKFVTSMTTTYTEEQMDEFLSSYYSTVLTTGSTDSESDYLATCLALDEDSLSFYTLKGTQKEDAYVLDPEKIIEDIKLVMGEDEYALATGTTVEDEDTDDSEEKDTDSTGEDNTTASEEATTEDENVISSKDKSISVYNGAHISGIAGKWSNRLEADGYSVQRVDNYTGETLEHGKIIVKEEGWGKDLQEEYFPEAVIEVGTPDYGMDIQIILGRSEDF